MKAADFNWRKGLGNCFFELNNALREMTEQAMEEQQRTHQKVSPRKYAKDMDLERAGQTWAANASSKICEGGDWPPLYAAGYSALHLLS